MKIKLQELREAQGSLMSLLGAKLEDFKLAYRLSKIANKVISEIKQFEKLRIEMVEKYGEKNKETGLTEVKKDKLEFFNKEIEKILEDEVELDIQLIPVDLIENAVKQKMVKLSGLDLSLLEKFIDTTAKPEKKEEQKKEEVIN